MRRMLVSAALGGAALLALAGPASAVTGDQTFVVFGTDPLAPTVVASGPIAGIGTDIESETEPSGSFVFPEGSVQVDHPPTSGERGFIESACVGVERFVGTYSLEGGTGDYADASGGGTYSGTDVVVLSRTPDGCGDEPELSLLAVTFNGTTTLP